MNQDNVVFYQDLRLGQRRFLIVAFLLWPLAVSVLSMLLTEAVFKLIPYTNSLQEELLFYLLIVNNSALLWPLYLIFVATPTIIFLKRGNLYRAIGLYMRSPIWASLLYFCGATIFWLYSYYVLDNPIHPQELLMGTIEVMGWIFCVGTINIMSLLLTYHFLKKRYGWIGRTLPYTIFSKKH